MVQNVGGSKCLILHVSSIGCGGDNPEPSRTWPLREYNRISK